MATKVNKVLEIKISTQEMIPPNLEIQTEGEVNSKGWSNGRLIPFVYLNPPEDGIYEFDFVADPPDGNVSQIISKITAEPFVWEGFPNELKGVKIYATSNYEVKIL